jgi:hypothetical protein
MFAIISRDIVAASVSLRLMFSTTAPSRDDVTVNLHTWTGFGSVPYWNAYVGVGEMHGSGTFFDARLSDPAQYPVAAKTRIVERS